MIPKIIHFVYIHNNEELPPLLGKITETWARFFPDWKCILWKDKTCRDFIKKNFPKYLVKYDSYPKDVQRADAIRYLVLNTIGGLYVDNDFECLENFESLFDNIYFLAGKEPKNHSDKYCVDYIIGNALMASSPNNPFINYVCDKLINYPSVEVSCGKDILDSTGPFLLTNTYNSFMKKDKIRILESKDFYPICKFETERLLKGNINHDLRNRIENAYAIHYALGTWENI